MADKNVESSPKFDLTMKLAIVWSFTTARMPSKHVQRGPVDPITHLWRSLVWGPDTFKGAVGLVQCALCLS